jgi:hypothetical protein
VVIIGASLLIAPGDDVGVDAPVLWLEHADRPTVATTEIPATATVPYRKCPMTFSSPLQAAIAANCPVDSHSERKQHWMVQLANLIATCP